MTPTAAAADERLDELELVSDDTPIDSIPAAPATKKKPLEDTQLVMTALRMGTPAAKNDTAFTPTRSSELAKLDESRLSTSMSGQNVASFEVTVSREGKAGQDDTIVSRLNLYIKQNTKGGRPAGYSLTFHGQSDVDIGLAQNIAARVGSLLSRTRVGQMEQVAPKHIEQGELLRLKTTKTGDDVKMTIARTTRGVIEQMVQDAAAMTPVTGTKLTLMGYKQIIEREHRDANAMKHVVHEAFNGEGKAIIGAFREMATAAAKLGDLGVDSMQRANGMSGIDTTLNDMADLIKITAGTAKGLEEDLSARTFEYLRTRALKKPTAADNSLTVKEITQLVGDSVRASIIAPVIIHGRKVRGDQREFRTSDSVDELQKAATPQEKEFIKAAAALHVALSREVVKQLTGQSITTDSMKL